MAQRYEAEELDDSTLGYLQKVEEGHGKGMPGVYLSAKSVVLIPLVLILTLGSLDDPTNVAFLQTAGLLLGGWLVVAWLRCRLAEHRDDWLGHFKFVDSVYLWHATGRGVWVTLIEDVEEASYTDNYDNQGNYSGSTVGIHTRDGTVDLWVRSEAKAEHVADFVNALADNADLEPVDRGYLAKAVVEGWEDEFDGRRARGWPVRDVPEPRKVRSNVSWAWRYPALVAAAVVLFFVLRPIDSRLRDDGIFDAVMHEQKAPALRWYLVDPRNRRHREEVEHRLGQLHDQSARRLLERPGGDGQLKAGLAAVAQELKKTPTPVMTMSFGEGPPPEAGKVPANWNATAQALRGQKDFVLKGMADHLTAALGEDLTDYGEAPGGTPAMAEVTYQPAGPGQVVWAVKLRPEPGAKPWVYRVQTTDNGAVAASEFLNHFRNQVPR
jgi:hypothetical protein